MTGGGLSNPTNVALLGALVPAIALAAAGLRYGWKYLMAFTDLFGHGKRIKSLEDTMATKSDLGDLKSLIQHHVADDAAAFQKLSADTASVRNDMARRTDLERVENNLTQILLDGFKAGNKRS